MNELNKIYIINVIFWINIIPNNIVLLNKKNKLLIK